MPLLPCFQSGARGRLPPNIQQAVRGKCSTARNCAPISTQLRANLQALCTNLCARCVVRMNHSAASAQNNYCTHPFNVWFYPRSEEGHHVACKRCLYDLFGIGLMFAGFRKLPFLRILFLSVISLIVVNKAGRSSRGARAELWWLRSWAAFLP